MLLSPDQKRFVKLHQKRAGDVIEYVEEWRELFRGGTIRARTNRGRCSSIARCQVNELIAGGLMDVRSGVFYLTEKGHEIQ